VSVTDDLLANNARYTETFNGRCRCRQDETGIKPAWAAEAFPDLAEDSLG
jgi:hypothetical protein